jgi:predicted nucleic acid-binding protein
MIIFLDTNVVIYLVENTPGFGPRATARFTAHEQAGDTFVVSDLVRMEARVQPTRVGDAALLARFDRFVALSNVQVVQLAPSKRACWVAPRTVA